MCHEEDLHNTEIIHTSDSNTCLYGMQKDISCLCIMYKYFRSIQYVLIKKVCLYFFFQLDKVGCSRNCTGIDGITPLAQLTDTEGIYNSFF